MTINKIENTIMARSKLSRECYMDEICLNFPNTLIATFLLIKKLDSPKFYPSAVQPYLLLKPAAFSPLLTKGLALSEKKMV